MVLLFNFVYKLYITTIIWLADICLLNVYQNNKKRAMFCQLSFSVTSLKK